MKLNKEKLELLIKKMHDKKYIACTVAAVIITLTVIFTISGISLGSKKSKSASKEQTEVGTGNELTGVSNIEQESIPVVFGDLKQDYFDINVKNEEESETETETETETEPETEPEPEMFVTTVEDQYMNVRKEPGTESEIVGKLYEGSGGTVVKKGDEWSLITSGNVTGYVYNKYVLFGEEAKEYAWDVGEVTAVATEDSLRIREGDSTKDDIVCVINKGTKLTVVEKGDEGWSEVICGKYMGFCSNDYLEFSVTLKDAMTIEEEKAWLAKEEAKKKAAEEAARKKAAEEKAALQKAIANSKFVETVQTSPYNVTEEDAYLLACIVHAEAHSTSYEGKLAVANVVLNRLKGGYYGNTISDVINYPNQFSVVNSGVFARVLKSGPSAECVKAAKAALSGTNNVPNYASFCSKSVANYSKYAEYTIIGTQVFYRRK